MFRTYLGTQSGVYRLEGERLIHLGLEGQTFWAIHAFSAPQDKRRENDTVLAGSYGQGYSAAQTAAPPGRQPIRA